MESQVCVNCLNKKPINSTTNRLVTESCGHVKCMDCLQHEKAGCVACLEESSPKEPEDTPEPSEGPASDGDNVEQDLVHADFPLKHFLLEEKTGKEVQTDYYSDKKKKLETSHIRIETDGNVRSYFCTVCKKKFQARSQVAYHAYCNGQRKPYQCPECSKSFATHSHFKYHMRVHRNERTYACELCGEGFFQMSKLQRHKLKHTKEKKYQCTECSKAFNNLTSLRKHNLTHSEERPYGCGTCGRRFRDSSNYRKHVAKHGGERDGSGCGRGCGCVACGRRRARAYQCPRCPQAFHARKDMRRHAAVHTDSKPFRCKVCSRRFRRKDNLERHIRNTHPQHAPASAVVCDDPKPDNREKSYENNEKSKLESLNPLPPLPPEVIEKHLCVDAEKERILEANNSRRSVIFGPVRAPPGPVEYVHKIRRAHRTGSAPPPPRLPPIDAAKLHRLQQLAHQNELDVGAPPEKYLELYKKILYERSAADRERELKESATSVPPVPPAAAPAPCSPPASAPAPACAPAPAPAPPPPPDDVHWRKKKIKLATNWCVFFKPILYVFSPTIYLFHLFIRQQKDQLC